MRPIVNFLQSITFHLHTDTNHLAHPGRYADYAPAWHFEFNLSPQADAEAVAVESKPAHLAQMRLEICRRDLADMVPDQCSCRK